MSSGLVRYQTNGDFHHITFSCVRHRPILGTPSARDTFLQILEQTRQKDLFEVRAYVVMPEHVHLLLSEPKISLLSTSIQVIKQRFSRTRPEDYVWEPRYHDRNIRTANQYDEALHYIHQNPVRRHLSPTPADWPWSSYLPYTQSTPAPVQITRPWETPK
jgi:putative transposase